MSSQFYDSQWQEHVEWNTPSNCYQQGQPTSSNAPVYNNYPVNYYQYSHPQPVQPPVQAPQMYQMNPLSYGGHSMSQVPVTRQLPQVQHQVQPQVQTSQSSYQMPVLSQPMMQPVQQVQPVQPAQTAQPVGPSSQPPSGDLYCYYPYAYAPRMAPTSLPSPTLEGTFDDYEESAMIEFLSMSAYSIMSNGTQMWTEAQIDAFQRFVQGVLRSTRLSKHTILLSLCYLSHRWSLGSFPDPRDCDYDMYYLMFVVSLALANKVHDDNTFTNSSWCQATGIPAAQVTKAEAHWLRLIGWDFDVRSTAHWYQWHDRYQSFLQMRQRAPLTPPGLWVPQYDSNLVPAF